jgi:hypothetical protein
MPTEVAVERWRPVEDLVRWATGNALTEDGA